MSFVGATGYSENQEQFDILKDEIDANASYINNLVGIPDPLHTAIFGINILNPGLFGLVERAEVKIKLLETGEETLGTDITGLTTQVEGIQTEVAGIQTEITGIQGEITGVQGEISSIQFIQLPALTGVVSTIGGIAGDAEIKANRALGIWDEDGNNVYHKKSGNVGIGTTFGSVLTNKLEVNGNINIPTGSTFRIGDEPFNYTHLAGTQPVSSKWNNATDVDTNIYYNSGNVGIGVTTAINNKLEVAGNINIPTGSKYKINNVDLAFSDLGTLSYNSLSDKPTLFDGNYNSLTNKLTGGTNIQILNGAINNLYSYTLPTAGIGSGGTLGGVRVDNSTIFINGSGVISSAGGTPQVNSDWNETNTSLKSFILNKPTIVNSRWSKTGNEIFYNDGNVGIGTTDPNRSLHLHKVGVLQEVGIILSDDSSTSTPTNNRGLHLIKASDNNGYLWNYENKDLLFATNAIERMRILANGRIGIGTNAPTGRLHLHREDATFSQDVNLHFTDTLTGITASDGFLIGKGSDNIAYLYNNENAPMVFSTNGGEKMRILANGNIGIGTNNPFSTLHLHKTATGQDVRIIISDGGTTASGSRGLHLIKGGATAYLYNYENADLIFGTNATDRMRILANGNIGIGISPSYKLDVNGNVYAGNNSFLLSSYDGTGARQFFGKLINAEIVAGMEIENTTLGGNWSQKVHLSTHLYGGGYGRRLTIAENGGVSMTGGLTVASAITCTNGQVYARNGFDTLLYADGGMMSICMGNAGSGTNATYLRIGAYASNTWIESSNNRSILFYIYSGTLSGTTRAWDFNINSGSYNALNSTTWTQTSDQRIKENIVKADLKTCYDNVKNINLYRFKYIDSFQTSKQDKNKLGYIAQEVKRHFPKATYRKKERLSDKREIPDLLSIDVEQINLTLYGAVKQLIKIVEKQNKRIKTLETLLNIDDNDDVENDAGEAYERIYDEEEVDIDTIEPTEPEQDKSSGCVPEELKAPEPTATSVNTEPSVEEEIEEINVD